MKKLAFYSLGTLAIAGILLFATNGCGARGKVAVDNLVSTVDKMLGELKVKRQQIADKMEKLDEGIDNIKKAKIETTVKAEMLKKKVDDQKALEEKAKGNLMKLSDMLKKAEADSNKVYKAENGKEYKLDTLKKTAEKLILNQKSIQTKRKGFEEAEETLKRVVKSLDSKLDDYTKTREKLTQTLDQIDAKRTAVEAMQSASSKIDGSDNLKDSIAKLEKDIEELNVSVETSLRLEDEKWAESEEADELKEVQSLLESSGDSSDLIGEIDALIKD